MPELDEYLRDAWNASVSPALGALGTEAVTACAMEIPLADLQAKRSELARVQQRDHVSRVMVRFLDKVIATATT